jgi:hypothetical protein
MSKIFKISSEIDAEFQQQKMMQVAALLPDLVHAVIHVRAEIKAWLEPTTDK